MKIKACYLYVFSFAAVLFLLACNLGGAAQGAPTPTLMALPGPGSDTARMPPPGRPGATPQAAEVTSPPVAQGGGGTVPICSLLTNDEAAAALGGAVTGAPREGGEPGRKFINCEYVLGQQGLTLQAGNAGQGKELLMAAAYNMQGMKASADEQKVIDDTAANLATLTLQEVFDRITPQYNSHCFIISDLPAAGNNAKWISCPALQYTAVLMRRGDTEDQLSFLDIVWLGSALSEADQQAKLVTAVSAALGRLPAGAQTVMGN